MRDKDENFYSGFCRSSSTSTCFLHLYNPSFSPHPADPCGRSTRVHERFKVELPPVAPSIKE